MSQAEPANSTNPFRRTDGAAIAASNSRVIAASIEELLRIRREADRTAAFLISLLDDDAVDPDIEEVDQDGPGEDGEHAQSTTPRRLSDKEVLTSEGQSGC